jgi:Uma2 family endonuclease
MEPAIPNELRRRIAATSDQVVVLRDIPWATYEALLAARGDRAGVRMSFLNGALELMSPSRDHEGIKTLIGRLLEAYAEELDLTLEGFGSMTMKESREQRGVEPDECYVLGDREPDCPDLAIEVVWSSGGIDKLEIYRTFRVREVWIWEDARITAYGLRDTGYLALPGSEVLPGIDLRQLAGFVGEGRKQTEAVRAWRKALRGG